MQNHHGEWIWYELLTSDADAAQAFYEAVVGWTVGQFPGEEEPGAGMDYRILTGAGGAGAGGLTRLPDGAPMQPGWHGYIGVHDVDAAVAAIEEAGGQVLMPALTMEGVGRMAFVADPQGVRFYVMKGASESPSTAYQRNALGHCAWNELVTADDTAALHFYGTHFGMVKDGAMPMGEMGDYSFLRSAHAQEPFGAVLRQPPGAPARWSFYFRVPDVDAAAEMVRAQGGQVIMGPMDVPGGERIVVCVDPQGASFGLVSGQQAREG